MAKTSAKKLNVTIREDLLERMDNYADENGMTRSGLIAIAVTQYLNAVEAMPSVNKLLNAMAAVSEGVLKGEMAPHEAEARMAAIQVTYEELTKKA
jgi:metal-responsive CopG/Arc/MetJ family transcriptional regulator